MGFQRMRGDPRIIPPNLVQQHITGHNPLLCAIEEFQDIRFFFREADFLFIFRLKQFHRGLKSIWPKLENRIFRLFVLAQLRANARLQHRKLERLGDIIICARIEAQDRISIAVMACEHDDRAFDPLLAHQAAQIAAIRIGQAHIQNHQIVNFLLGLFHRLGARARLEHIEILSHHELF